MREGISSEEIFEAKRKLRSLIENELAEKRKREAPKQKYE